MPPRVPPLELEWQGVLPADLRFGVLARSPILGVTLRRGYSKKEAPHGTGGASLPEVNLVSTWIVRRPWLLIP